MALVTANGSAHALRRHRAQKEHDWQALGSTGSAWLEAHGFTGDVDQCRGVGYALMVYELSNASPGRIVRASVNMANGEVESVVEDNYPARIKRWTDSRDAWVKTEVLPQHGLRAIPKPEPVTEDIPITEERDRVFERVKGKGLQEYSERPAPPGHKWVLQSEIKKGKPRGLPFRKGKDARRYQEQSRG